jgi:hypothetical protein
MANIAIFRKDAEGIVYPSKVSATVLAPFLAMLTAKVRVKRPQLVEHFLPTSRGRSAFARQTAVTRSDLHHLADCRRNGVMTDRARATLACAYIVAPDEIGRAPKTGERDYDSAAQSILLYLKDRVGTYSLSESDVFTVDPLGSDISVTVV